jgi:hypothetical protein
VEERETSGRKSLIRFNDANPASGSALSFPLWLGVLGWALQSFVEFGLYIPALAWPAFAFLGYLVGIVNHPNPVDIPQARR